MKPQTSRRGFFKTTGAVAVSALSVTTTPNIIARSTAARAPALAGIANLDVKKIDSTWIDLPYKPVPKRHMYRERAGYGIRVIWKVTLANGIVGIGDSGSDRLSDTPIPQEDVAGNKFLRSRTRVPIAMHYGNPLIMTALREEVCDGFIISGGASHVLEQATVAATAAKPFWRWRPRGWASAVT